MKAWPWRTQSYDMLGLERGAALRRMVSERSVISPSCARVPMSPEGLQLGGFVVVADSEHSIAGEVHALLLSAHPEQADVNLIKAAELASQQQEAGHDLRAITNTAIQKVMIAIAEGASAAEGEQLLLESIRAAEHWVVAHG